MTVSRNTPSQSFGGRLLPESFEAFEEDAGGPVLSEQVQSLLETALGFLPALAAVGAEPLFEVRQPLQREPLQ